ncbi:colicin lysis protein [uncultured Brachyspira sp.]|uniref:colicin lysis protein n=1 Tax=uncultured Brachyspira sp. TaxID=221953 RepID=UPI00259B580D|nr:colicin lysis protein [uncultured Brachyspira sp.]
MKKVCYVFMISLTLINFWGCAKKSIQPIGGTKTEVYFSYLNDDYEVVENRTKNLWMKINGVSENLFLVSSKTNEDEYTAILTDEKNNITVAMVYKDGKNFPDYITFAKDNQIVRGTASDYVNGAFDVLWELNDFQEVFYNIKLTNDIDYYNNISGLDKTENYQAKTIITSLKIWDAINNYVQEPNNRPSARFFGIIFGFFLAISIPAAAIITAAVVVVTAIVTAVAVVLIKQEVEKKKRPPENVIPTPENPISFPEVPTFSVKHNGVDVKDGDILTIDYKESRMTIAAPEEPKNEYIENYHSRLTLNPIYCGNHKELNNAEVFAYLKGNYNNQNSIVEGYYRFYFDKKIGEFTDRKSQKIMEVGFSQSNYMKLDIDKINKTPSDISNVVLKFVFTNTIEIYGRMASDLSIEFN